MNDKVSINVATPFTVIVDLGTGGGPAPFRVEAGVQSVPKQVAENWYTQLHLAKGGFGSPEYARGAREAADAAFFKADEAVKHYEGLEKAAHDAELAAGLEPTEPAFRRLRKEESEEDEGPELEDDPKEPELDADKQPAADPPSPQPEAAGGEGANQPGPEAASGGGDTQPASETTATTTTPPADGEKKDEGGGKDDASKAADAKGARGRQRSS